MWSSEIVLTGIHTGNYGVDLENYSLAKLLKIMSINNLKSAYHQLKLLS